MRHSFLVVKKQKNNTKSKSFPKGTIIGIAVIAAAAIGGGAYFWTSAIPVNGNTPVFAAPSNIYIKAIHTDQGYAYDEQSTRTGKRSLTGENIDPSIHIPKDTLVSLHVINEDKDTLSQQDLNIDEFNVHTRHLNYFEAQTINFVADKTGTFSYYSNLHPEMKGSITVDP